MTVNRVNEMTKIIYNDEMEGIIQWMEVCEQRMYNESMNERLKYSISWWVDECDECVERTEPRDKVV